MFNPTAPYNDLPPLPMDGIDFESKKILRALAWAKAAIGRLDVYTKFLPNNEIFLSHFAIKESVESSQIENLDTSVSEIYEASRVDEKYRSNEQKEVMFYKTALMHGVKLVREKWFLGTNEYAQIWRILSPTKGQIRNIMVDIKKNGTEVIYTPPASKHNIDALLGNYEKYYNNMIPHKIDPLIKMAMLHYQFEAIHPFLDGNGRTGRILMVLHLLLSKHLEFPIIFLSWFINKNKSVYYRLLLEVTTHKNWEEFIVFILKAIEVQSLETINQIESIRKLRDSLVATLQRDPVIKSILAEPLATLLISKPKLLRVDLEPFATKNTLTKYIKQLVGIWLLEESWSVWNVKIYTNVKFIELTQ